MSGITAILFDNDGVLAHTERYWFEANCTVCKELGIPYTRDDFIEHTFTFGSGSSGWLQKNGYDENIIRDFTLKRNALWKNLIQSETLTDPKAFHVLRKLRADYTVGIVTNTSIEMFDLIDKDAVLENVSDVIVYREDYDKPKPAPDAYQAALTLLQRTPSQVIVVEDSARGIESAQNAGMKVVSVTNPDFNSLDVSKADYHIKSLDQLPDLLENL